MLHDFAVWYHFESLAGWDSKVLAAKKTHNAAHAKLLNKQAEYVVFMNGNTSSEIKDMKFQEELAALEGLVTETGKNIHLEDCHAHTRVVSYYQL